MRKRIFWFMSAVILATVVILVTSLTAILFHLAYTKNDSIYALLVKFMPMVAVCVLAVFVVSLVSSKILANKIIEQINKIDTGDGDIYVYDELAPFIKKIKEQKDLIITQFSALNSRSNVINAISENMKEGLILIDNNGMILSANISAQQIFGEKDMVSKNILHICRDIELIEKTNKCLAGKNDGSGSHQNYEMLFQKDKKTYNVYLSPVNNAEVGGAIILFLDTTEKYIAEKQRKEFSANVSHELRTPLTTISALAEMIGTGMAKEKDIKDFSVKITNQTRRLINIVDDIIRLSEFDEGDIGRQHSNFDVYSLAVSVSNGLREKAKDKNVDIKILGAHIRITANERMIDELLFNLLDNAIKYNKDGGKITVSVSTEGDFCKISVADTGIGIPKEHQTRIFERFYRVDKSRSQKTGGTGLGLSIVKHITEYHKGRIEVESEENTGTSIICYIKMIS